VLANNQNTFYTRAGAFDVDSAGYLVDQLNGLRVQRYGAIGEGPNGFQVAGDMDVRVPFGAGIAGVPTANVVMQANLSAEMPIGDFATAGIQVYDTQSSTHALNLVFTKTAANTFTLSATVSGGTVTVPPGDITFDSNGLLIGPGSIALTLNGLPGPQTVTLQLGTPGMTDGLTQFGGPSSAAAISQDGSAAGTLTDVSVDTSGIVQGLFSNGLTVALAQLAVARFNNDSGLLREGNNNFSTSPASGNPLLGSAGTAGRGTIIAGTLEGSNVDIAQEFSRLILAQRGFQINARVITLSNEVLQELSTIIR
jgi:flagellar hook protein FlgE